MLPKFRFKIWYVPDGFCEGYNVEITVQDVFENKLLNERNIYYAVFRTYAEAEAVKKGFLNFEVTDSVGES